MFLSLCTGRLGHECQPFHHLSMWPWASHSAPCVCIPIYKIGMLIVSKQGFSGVNEMANGMCT